MQKARETESSKPTQLDLVKRARIPFLVIVVVVAITACVDSNISQRSQ